MPTSPEPPVTNIIHANYNKRNYSPAPDIGGVGYHLGSFPVIIRQAGRILALPLKLKSVVALCGEENFNDHEKGKIYIDRSWLKLTNIKGTPADVKPGMLVEIKYVDNRRGGLIEWIKVQLE